MTAALAIAVYVAITVVGFFFWRSGRRAISEGRRLRGQALLADLPDSTLQTRRTTRWPTDGRWPGPTNHREELESDVRRRAYARLARGRSQTLRRSSEIILIVTTAVASVVLATSIGGILDLDVSPVADSGLGAFVPFWSAWQVLQVAWKAVVAFIAVLFALELRGHGEYLAELAEAYESYAGQAQGAGEGRAPWWRRLLRVLVVD